MGLDIMKEFQDKISIIVPAYNEGSAIGPCLESIINQTYTNLEIIIVYKESLDRTLEIIQSFNDSRIKVIVQEENSDAGGARNIGLKHASGDYIGFVECAVIDENYYSKLINRIKEDSSDIAVALIDLCNDNVRYQTLGYPNKKRILTKLIDKIPLLRVGACFNKLFKASLLKEYNIEFAENLKWEDNPFVLKALYYSKKVSLLDDCTYNYNPTVYTPRYKERLISCIIPIVIIMSDFAKEKKFSWKEKRLLRRMMFKSFIGSFIVEKDIYKNFVKYMGFSPYIAYRYWRLSKKVNKNKKKGV